MCLYSSSWWVLVGVFNSIRIDYLLLKFTSTWFSFLNSEFILQNFRMCLREKLLSLSSRIASNESHRPGLKSGQARHKIFSFTLINLWSNCTCFSLLSFQWGSQQVLWLLIVDLQTGRSDSVLSAKQFFWIHIDFDQKNDSKKSTKLISVNSCCVSLGS